MLTTDKSLNRNETISPPFLSPCLVFFHLAAVLFFPPDDRASLTSPLLVPLNETFVTMEPFTCKCLLPTDISSSLFQHRYQPAHVSLSLSLFPSFSPFLSFLLFFSSILFHIYICIYTFPSPSPRSLSSTCFVSLTKASVIK